MTKSKVYLLDSNVLIALATPEHSLNARAAVWFRKGHRFATCPITQGALLRFHLRAGVEATAESAKLLLESISALPRHEFWPDDASYLEIPTTGIIGHRQVTCQLRLKIPQSAGGKFPSPRRVVVYRFASRMVHTLHPVKRRRALLESNSPRNSRLQTHQDDETRGEAVSGLALGLKRTPHRIDRFAHALKTQTFRLPRPLGAPARCSSCCCSGSGIRPALRRSLSR